MRVHSQAFVPEFTRLCESCWVGPNVVLTNARYPKSIGVKENLKGPTVGRFAKVGANATVLPGLVIGDNSLIGAGSVVVKDVESNTVVVGNPAKKIKSIDLLPYEVQ